MSKQTGVLYNNATKESALIYDGFSWPCLFLGPIWFLVKGLWLWVLVSGIVGIPTFFASNLIFAFFANKLNANRLRSKGWSDGAVGSQPPLVPQQVPQSQAAYTTTPALAATDVSATQAFSTPAPMEEFSGNAQFGSKSMIFARLDQGISWRHDYDVIDLETGNVFLEIREGEISKIAKAARMGENAPNTSYDAMVMDSAKAHLFRIKYDFKMLRKVPAEVLSPSGILLGKIAMKGLTVGSFQISDGGGVLRAETKAKGFGHFAGDPKIFVNGNQVGAIKIVTKSEAKELMGANYEKFAGSKYIYNFHLEITQDLSNSDKLLLIASTFHQAHWKSGALGT